MNIEKAKLPEPKPASGLLQTLRSLKPGQCLRLTTAKEAYAMGGLRGLLAKEGLKTLTKLDGDDVLVWVQHHNFTQDNQQG